MTAYPAVARCLEGAAGGILLICDHASNAVPPGLDLGVAPGVLDKHVGVDIGAEPLTEALSAALDAPAILATVSRLVIDLHRQPDHPGLIPPVSDGHLIPGNVGVDRFDRIARFYAPYHAALDSTIRRVHPSLLVSIHSFTPRLESVEGSPRPWEIGILSNRDRRAADIALGLLAAKGLVVGDNQPYSGRVLNATLNRHGEARGIASIAIEIRNDLIANGAEVQQWCDILAPILAEIRNRLAREGVVAT
jgi:predicted N-formylglutamate amidohydrolase